MGRGTYSSSSSRHYQYVQDVSTVPSQYGTSDVAMSPPRRRERSTPRACTTAARSTTRAHPRLLAHVQLSIASGEPSLRSRSASLAMPMPPSCREAGRTPSQRLFAAHAPPQASQASAAIAVGCMSHTIYHIGCARLCSARGGDGPSAGRPFCWTPPRRPSTQPDVWHVVQRGQSERGARARCASAGHQPPARASERRPLEGPCSCALPRVLYSSM